MNVPSNIAVPSVPSAHPQNGHSEAGVHRVGLLVLGMHRSGTSALTGMLSLLGCSLPRNLLGGNDTNPTGHWESAEAMVFNDELLARAGSAWDDWTALAEGFFTAPGYPELVTRGAELLRGEFGSAPLFVFKDPRNCRLARFWLDVFEAEAIRPLVVIPIRNPLEVAQSLKTRNRADEHYGPLLWLRHVLDAEIASRGRPRAFTTYDQMLDCWEVVAGRLQQDLGIAWPRMSPATQDEIGAFVDKHYRREIVTTDVLVKNEMISGWVRRTWDILNKWAMDGEDAADHAELDAIAGAFEEAAPAFARLILRGKRAQHQVDELEHALAETHSRIAEIEGQTAQQLHHQHEVLTQEAEQARAECAALRIQVVELAGLRDAAEGQTATTASRNAELERLLAEAQSQAEAAAEQLRDVENRLAENAGRIAEQESALIQRREENEQAWAALALEQAGSDGLRNQLADALQREEAQQQRLTEAEAWVFRLAAERQAAQKEAKAARAARAAAERAKASAEAEAERRTTEITGRLRQALAGETDNDAELAKQTEEAARLTILLGEAQRRAEAADARAQGTVAQQTQLIEASRARYSKLEQQVAEAQQGQADADAARRELATGQTERFHEIAVLTRLLRDREHDSNDRNGQIEWLRRTQMALGATPFWWSFLPRASRRRRELALLLRKGLFDGDSYLARYPDVAAEGMDPLRHYVAHGIGEGRVR